MNDKAAYRPSDQQWINGVCTARYYVHPVHRFLHPGPEGVVWVECPGTGPATVNAEQQEL